MSASGKSDLFGSPRHVGVERGLSEFRSGRPVVLTSESESVVVLPVDGMTDQGLAAFRQLFGTKVGADTETSSANKDCGYHRQAAPAGDDLVLRPRLAGVSRGE